MSSYRKMICISGLLRAFSSPFRRETPRTGSPTISLLKLRSVCREWRYTIDNPHFAAMHTMTGVESPRILMLSELSHGADPRFAVEDELLVTTLPKLVTELWRCRAVPVCRGLLCFEEFRDGTTCLLNPLTRETVSLESVRVRYGLDSIGIGVDRLTSWYKIPRVSYSLHSDWSVRPSRAKVLDQGSRSWGDVASVPPSCLLGDPVFTAGSINWNVTGRGDIDRISSFDVAKEEFEPTPCPELRLGDTHLVDLRGVLGLIDRSRQESVDVWAMAESGLWVKKYRIPLRLPGELNSHQFGEFLGYGGWKMVLEHLRSLLSYDPAPPARVMGSITGSLLSPAKLWNGDKVLPFSFGTSYSE